MTCLSCPPPIFTPPCECDCGALDAPDKAVNVPANADVDQLGRLAARGDAVDGIGLFE
jgi:hypothetical protein